MTCMFTPVELEAAARTIAILSRDGYSSMEQFIAEWNQPRMPADHPAVAYLISKLSKPSCLAEQLCPRRKVCDRCVSFFHRATEQGRRELTEPGTMAAVRIANGIPVRF